MGFQFFANLHQPVYDAFQVDDASIVPVAFEVLFDQPSFCRKPLPVVVFGLPGEQVNGSDQGKGGVAPMPLS